MTYDLVGWLGSRLLAALQKAETSSQPGHAHTASDVTDFNSSTRAQVEAALIAGSNVTITPAGSGATRTLTIAATGGGGGGAPNVRWIGAGELIPRVTNGPGIDGEEFGTNRQNLDYLAFDPAAAEFAQAWFAWPGSATTATARLYWTAASGSGAVVWRVALRCYADDDAIDQAFGTAQSVTDTLLAANDVHQSDATSAITPGGTAGDRRLTCVQIERNAADAADTLGVDARLIGVLLEFA